MTSTEMLRGSALFSGLTDDQLERVADLVEEVVCQDGEVIVREGEAGDEVYVVRDGMVEVRVPRGAVPDVPGPPRTTSIVALGTGQSFGEMALVDQGARSATVSCLEDDTSLYVLRRRDLLELCEDDPEIGYLLMRNIAVDLSFKLRHRNLRLQLEGGENPP